MLDGARVSSAFVDVAPTQLGRLIYATGNVPGTNDFVVEAIDDLGLDSNDLQVRLNVTAPHINQRPSLTGPSNLTFTAGQTIAASQLYATATDADGSVATIQFWDSVPGAGYLMLDGVRVDRPSVEVALPQLHRLAYFTGSAVGANDLVINAIDNQGSSSLDFSLRLSIASAGDTVPSGPNGLVIYQCQFAG
jgi:hypothetical protein